MTKDALAQLFVRSIQDAIFAAQRLTDRKLPSDFEIELHGGGVAGRIVALSDAMSHIYIDEDTFHPIVDIGLKRVRSRKCVMFVRISPQSPTTFDRTWNTPPGNGPFKIIEPLVVQFDDE
jgi:hypothetical protein